MGVAEYDLADVRRAAESRRIEYRGRGIKIQNDLSNLGLSFDDVVCCLCALKEKEFKRTHVRDDTPPDDVYIFWYRRVVGGEVVSDELYVKFCMMNGFLDIEIASFHLR